MPIPSYFELIHPLLLCLEQHPEGVRASSAHECVADRAGISEQERLELLPSGRQAVYKNRIGWAHDRLKRGGYSTSPQRGVWRLTKEGLAFASAHREGLPDAEVQRLAYVGRDTRLRGDEGEPEQRAQPAAQQDADQQAPDERIEAALQELNDSVASELLDLIAGSSPTFFERLVLELLHAMGYGATRAGLQRVGGSGDGGIDGIISLDRLGLEKVYVQAKRWQNTVGRPDVQGFFGALAGRRAKKGVFITTSTFTREAREFAQQVPDSIVLVDGSRLTTLMIEHGVGVTHKALRLPHVDSDFFDEA